MRYHIVGGCPTTEKTVNVRLSVHRDMLVVIMSEPGKPEWCIVGFNKDGYLERYASLPGDLGLKIDCNGKVCEIKEP